MPNVIEYKDWLFVVMPEYDYEPLLDLQPKEDWYKLDFLRNTDKHLDSVGVTLPPGSYQIIGKGDALDNSQWSEIVDSKKERGGAFNPEVGHYQSTGWTTFYKNYEHPEPSVCIPNTATESGHSLLRSLGMEPETTLVLKKNS